MIGIGAFVLPMIKHCEKMLFFVYHYMDISFIPMQKTFHEKSVVQFYF